MALDLNKKPNIPEGLAFLKSVWKYENTCEEKSDERISSLGKKVPACLEHIGTVLSLLDRVASCWWGCQKGDHRIEYICGRVTSNARAALRLLRFGFYDEALVLCRGIGETANLFQLFTANAESLKDWKESSPQRIRQRFSAVKVRLRLEKLSIPPIVGEEQYRVLSARATHVHPETKPQSHNIWGIPIAGAHLQDEGLLVCLNELAWPLSLTAAGGAAILGLEKGITKRIALASLNLIQQIGGLKITDIENYHTRVLKEIRLAAEKDINRQRTSESLGPLQPPLDL